MLDINKTKWNIIKELSQGDKTPTELSKRLKLSLPSIHEQLKALEQKNLIEKKGQVKGKTRPYAEYSIGNGFIYFMKVLPKETEQRFLPIDENLKLHLRIWSIPQKRYHYYLENFWWRIQDYLEDIETIVIYGSVAKGEAREDSDIDILILVKKDVKKYEEKFNAFAVGPRGKKEIIMTQIFQISDFENSLRRGSKFSNEVMKNHKIIYDPNKIFEKLKDGFN